nr:microfibril-associated glycoprotein 4-like isoform X1 [Leptinotarsa decemlineata]
MFVNRIILSICLLVGTCYSINQQTENENNHRNDIKDLTQISNDSGEFILTKFLDVRSHSDYEHLHPDLKEVIRYQIGSVQRGESQIDQTRDETKHEKICQDISNKTPRLQSTGRLSNKDQLETLIEKLENIVKSQSSFYSDFTSNCKSQVGVDKSHFCNQHQKSNRSLPKSCKEIQTDGQNISGIYEIQPTNAIKPFMVLCDMETEGGGWTHIHRRLDGSQDFFLGWREYKFGFGNLNEEFWLGLENIHISTDSQSSELLVEITDRDNITAYAHYKEFAIGSEQDGYSLKNLGKFSGDAGDSLRYHLGKKFTTKDYDQDEHPQNCAVLAKAAWWFGSCYESSLNGKFVNVVLSDAEQYSGLHWRSFRKLPYCHARARMLIRPV